MADVRDAIESFRMARPDADEILRELLTIDADTDTWEFDDVDIGTGVFGDLVSRGIVEQQNGGYRLADRAAVEAAITDSADTQEKANGDAHSSLTSALPSIGTTALPTVSRRHFIGACLAIGFVIAFRLVSLLSVYQSDYVVLLANDPYYYRYWLFDFVHSTRSPLVVSEGIQVGEPLLLAALQLTTALFGKTPATAEQVLAWYPVVAAVGCALATYWIGLKLTDDHRVAIASVVFLAVLPAHGYRTLLGFADHHAFDFLLLGITFASVISFEHASITALRDLSNRNVWPWVFLAGVGIGAHVLAWNAGALLLVPLAVFAVVRALMIVKNETSVAPMGPLLLSAALGGIFAYLGHSVLDWQQFYMVLPPLLLAVGVAILTGVVTLARRQGLSIAPTSVGLVASSAILIGGAVLFLPEFGTQFVQETSRLVLGSGRNISETQSLFSTDFGFIVAPFGYFGLSIFFALPVFGWASWFGWTENRGDWLTLGAYAWVLFVLSIFQVRFAGHLALPTAVGAGFAFIWLTAKVGELSVPGVGSDEESDTRPSWAGIDSSETGQTDDRDLKSTMSVLVAIFLLMGGLGAVMTPARADVLTPERSAITATEEMDAHASAHNLQWPENYVFSEWGDNRMYNAFINGESRSYGYARANFVDFLSSTDNSGWYQRLQGRAGFVVVTELEGFQDAPGETIYAQLQRDWGINTHYRVLFADNDGRKAFAIVPGTVVSGSATGETVTVSGTMEFNDRTQDVSTTVPVENGTYSVRIATPGAYTIGNQTVTVTEDDVLASS